MSATIRDLAKHCGLSVSAVSKALNGYTDISEETRKAVEEAARALDYHPNAHARALKAGCSYNIGVLFADDSQSGLTHPFFSQVLENFKREAEAAGYDITFISHRMGSGRVTYLDHCRYRHVDGVCIACVDFDSEEVRRLIESDLPVVTIDRIFEGRDSVYSDNADGIRRLTEYVYKKGHRRVAYIHGPRSAVTDERVNSFRETAARLGLDIPKGYMPQCEYINPVSAYKAAMKLLRLKERPTCVLVSDDYSAIGVIQAIGEAGLSIPGDISVAGYDGINQMQHFSPRLTTVRQDTAALGRESARQLISLIEKTAENTPRRVVVPSEMITGQTVADIRE